MNKYFIETALKFVASILDGTKFEYDDGYVIEVIVQNRKLSLYFKENGEFEYFKVDGK